MSFKFNPITGELDLVNKSGIPEYTSDPVSPAINDAWVVTGVYGTPVGLLLAITDGSPNYKLSYKTISGSIVRVILD
jgi:hypothetical protein